MNPNHQLHKCDGCVESDEALRCRIFLQTTAYMETLLAYRKCCFKVMKT
jgi:hypothetical protein